MSDQIFFNGVRYISAHEAADASNLTRDYIARLCRDNKIRGRRVGKNWYIDDGSLREFLVQQEYTKSKRHEQLTEQRLKEYKNIRVPLQASKFSKPEVLAPIKEFHDVPFEKKNISSLSQSRAFNVHEKIKRAVSSSSSALLTTGGSTLLTTSGKSFARVSKMARTPGALDSVAHTYATYALSPTVEFLHKLTALTVAFMLTFGTYTFVDPHYAKFVRDSLYETGDALSDSYMRVTKGGVLDMFARANHQLAAVASNPGAAAERVSNIFAQDIPLFLRALARTVNTNIDGLVYGIAFPEQILASRERAAVSVMVTPRAPSVTSTANGAIREADSSGIAARADRVFERTQIIERIVASGGISEAVLNAKLEQLDNKLSSKMYSLSSANSTSITNVYNTVARTNRIDTLGDVDISSSRWVGGTITGASITASDLSVTSNATVSGSLTVTGVSTFGTAVSTTASSTNMLSTYATTTNFFATNASTTRATSTNLYATAFIVDSATSTNFFSTLARLTTSIVTTLTAAVATITDLTTTNLSAVNATTTSATSTSLAIFTSPIAPAFTATSTAATSTFSGGFSAASSLYVLQNGRIGVGTATPTPTAILQINSTSAGFLPPRLTTSQKTSIASPAAGLVLYDSDLNKLNVYNGSQWKNVGNPEINGEVTNGTANSILFVGQGGVLGQDQNHFTYSTSTRSFGVGTSSPYAKFAIHGNSNDTTIAQTLFSIASSTESATSTFFTISNTGAVVSAGPITSTATGANTFPFASSTALTVSGTAFLTSLTGTAATSTSLFGGSLKSNLAFFGQTATSSFSSTGALTLAGGNSSMLLALDASGVLIGTSTPSAMSFNATSSSATSTFAGALVLSRPPTSAHTFSAWAIGAANSKASDASLVVNPSTSVADGNLISASVGEAVRFLVDAEGDVFLNNLTSTGSVTLSTTTASTFTVENNTTFGDAITDSSTINGTLTVSGTTSVATVAGNFGVASTSPWAKLSVHANSGEGNSVLFAVASSTATATTTLFSVPNSTSATSTFATNLQATALNITSSTASSTFANGINISAGCLALNGTCLGSQLDSLKDVTITAAAYGDLLMHNGTDWVDTATSTLFSNSTQLSQWLSDETGTGNVVYSASPTFTGTSIFANLSATEATSTSIFGSSLKTLTAVFGQSASSSFSSAGVLTLASDLAVSEGGTGASTLTGLLQGNGTSAFTVITDSSTVGQILRVSGASTYAWGALDLADTDAVTGILAVANGGTNASKFGNHMLLAFDGTRLVSTSTPTMEALLATSTTATSSFAGPLSIGSTTPNGAHLFSIGTSSPLFTVNNSTGDVNVYGKATTTFSQGIQTTALNITSSTATSTFANGINISAGCLALNGTCLGSQLDSLKDVTITASAYGDLLMHNGTDWVDTATSTLFSNSTQLSQWLSDETGTGNVVFSASPTFTGTAILANLSATEATSTSIFGSSLKTLTAVFGQSASSSFSSAGVLTLASDLAVSEGGTGASTLTGLLQGNGTSAFTVITDSSTVGQILRVSGASTYAWGALDLADTDAVTGILAVANGGTNASKFGNHMLLAFDGTRLVSTSTPTMEALLATSTTATSSFAGPLSIGSTTPNGAHLFSIGTSSPLFTVNNSTGDVNVYGKATTTFSQGIQTTALNITSSTASSTFANGINISAGCLALNGTCLGSQLDSLKDVTITAAAYGDLLMHNGTDWVDTATSTLFSNSTQLSQWLSDETGTGNVVFSASPTFTGTAILANLSATEATSTSIFGSSLKTLTAVFGQSASSSFSSAGVLTLASDLAVSEGGTGAGTLTGLLQGNGTSAFTVITDSSTVGQILRVTGASAYAWGALDLADTDAVTGILAVANGGTNASKFGNHMLLAFDGTRLVSTSTPTMEALLATSTTATSSFAGPLSIGSTTPNGAHLFSIGTSSPLFTVNNSTGDVNVYGKATTTFSQGIQTTALNITSSTASSTFANGIQLTSGCFRLPSGECAGTGGSGSGIVGTGAVGQFSYYAAAGTTLTATSSIFVATNENVGVGTTTPQWDFQVAGTRPSIALSDTSASTNNQHWLLTSQNGNLYVGTSTNAYATSSPAVLSLSGSATSTFALGLQAPVLNITSSSASSTFANGIQLSGGCFLNRNGQCVDNSTSVTLSQVVASSSPGSNTSFTVPTNTAYIVVETWGGGGGGGGNASAGGGASGGGGGGYSQKVITAPSGTYYYTVGTGGTAGSGGVGGGGGTSCFGTNTTACTSPALQATGGVAGNGANPAPGGIGSLGDVNLQGSPSGPGVDSSDAGTFTGGSGGSSPRGGGGGLGYFNIAGSAGNAFGGGGGGGGYSTTAKDGGAGGAGGVTIYVYTTQTLTSSGAGVTLTRTLNYTSGSGTYTPPSNISYVTIEMVGGGGGGGGSGVSCGTAGTDGGDTTFGSYTAGKGSASGNCGSVGGAGGTYSGSPDFGVNGGRGGGSNTNGGVYADGGMGGSSYYGGSGGGSGQGAGQAGATNSGGGGGGGGGPNTASMVTGGGGGSGAYLKTTLTAPSGNYSYAVGAAGGAGAAGTSGAAGGAGAAGRITIYEYTTGAATAGSVGSGTQGQFAFYNAAGSNLTATSSIYLATSGNVGIGTAAPANTLHLLTADLPLATTDTANLVIGTSNAAATGLGGGIGFAHNGVGGAMLASIKGVKSSTGTNRGELIFATRSDAAFATERMRIDYLGNVGIGKTSPSTALDIAGTASSTGLQVNGDAAITGTLTTPAISATANLTLTATQLFFSGLDDENTSGNVLCQTASAEIVTDSSDATVCDGASSDIRIKTNIAPITDALSRLRTLTPINFDWLHPELHNYATSTNGLIAQELELMFPNVVEEADCKGAECELVTDGKTKSIGVGSPEFISYLVAGIKELDARTGFISNAFGTGSTGSTTLTTGSSPQTAMWIDSHGAIGIGTTTPQYKLHVIGDVAAQSFVNISTRESKTDISEVDMGSEDRILSALASTTVFSYRYKNEASSTPMHLGLITDEAPPEVLSIDGGGVDLYKLAAFTFAGVKAQQRQINTLASTTAALGLRVDTIEQALANLNLGNLGSNHENMDLVGPYMDAVLTALKTLGAEIVNGLTRFAYLVVEQLAVGSPEQPTGITLYDKATGEPYCFSVENGTATTSPGLCAAIPQVAGAAATGGGAASSSVPVIEIQGNNPATISVGSTYSDLGALITGPTSADTNLGLRFFVNGTAVLSISLDTSAPGTHTIEYVATNDSGTATSTRTVIVEAPADSGGSGGDAGSATSTPDGGGEAGSGSGGDSGTATSTPDGGSDSGDTDSATTTPPTP